MNAHIYKRHKQGNCPSLGRFPGLVVVLKMLLDGGAVKDNDAKGGKRTKKHLFISVIGEGHDSVGRLLLEVHVDVSLADRWKGCDGFGLGKGM